MPKNAAPWFRASSGTWVVRQDGKLKTLARGADNRAEAVARWRELQEAVVVAEEAGCTVGELADRYLAAAEGCKAPNTVVWYRRHLGRFVAFIGRDRPLRELRASDCLDWLASTTWGQSTRHGAINVVKQAMDWAVLFDLAASNPFAAVPKPGILRKEHIPTTSEVAELLDGARGGTRDYLVFLAETGCRQSEVYELKVEHVDLRSGVCRLNSKTSRKTGRLRVIYMTATAKAIVARRIVGLSRGGHIFVNRRGGAWNLKRTKEAVKQIRRRLGLGGHVTAGRLRHWWITERLRAGVPIAHVAELAGHTSTAMIANHYGHLSDHGADLRRALERRAS